MCSVDNKWEKYCFPTIQIVKIDPKVTLPSLAKMNMKVRCENKNHLQFHGKELPTYCHHTSHYSWSKEILYQTSWRITICQLANLFVIKTRETEVILFKILWGVWIIDKNTVETKSINTWGQNNTNKPEMAKKKKSINSTSLKSQTHSEIWLH